MKYNINKNFEKCWWHATVLHIYCYSYKQESWSSLEWSTIFLTKWLACDLDFLCRKYLLLCFSHSWKFDHVIFKHTAYHTVHCIKILPFAQVWISIHSCKITRWWLVGAFPVTKEWGRKLYLVAITSDQGNVKGKVGVFSSKPLNVLIKLPQKHIFVRAFFHSLLSFYAKRNVNMTKLFVTHSHKVMRKKKWTSNLTYWREGKADIINFISIMKYCGNGCYAITYHRKVTFTMFTFTYPYNVKKDFYFYLFIYLFYFIFSFQNFRIKAFFFLSFP